jgi:hypothetical protein
MKKERHINVWIQREKTTICLGDVDFLFVLKAWKSWLSKSCFEITGITHIINDNHA